ncbi:fibrillin-2-like [Pimephales promelas]|uniref:fibrillin-2-like n=1 Tax=Pimephales promelas TaxID=90988 RepID=UPI0019558B41|nr:fibrillin-2-like [Pimephales promelas]
MRNMATQGKILKYFAGIIMTLLLTHECVVETLDFPETSIDLEFSYIDGQLHHRLPRSAELLEFIVVIEVNASQAVVIEQIRASLASITFPLQLDNSTEITAANITTVCQPNVTEYQCVCEDGYAWTYNNCKSYEACDDISLGSCGCISGIPSDGEMCVLESELPFTDLLFEIEMESSSISVIDEMRRYFQNMTFPLRLDELVEVLDVDITTVCNFNDSGYKCVCEDQYFWPCEKCTEYGSCDDITNNTCSCINDIPTDRQFCQPVNEITNNTTCGKPPTVPAEYLTEIQIDAENTFIIDQLMSYLMAFSFPYKVSDSTNITEINITTVCSLNQTQYQCKCEGLFVWPNDTCHSYETCDDIIDGSCTCINALPVNGQFCQLKEAPPSNYEIDIDVRFFDLFLVNYLRSLIMNISLPLTLSNSINITDIDMTTVCGLNGTQYECKCEERHVWPNDTCRAYHECDEIVGGTCGCIQALPSEGPLCQRDINECEDAVSVCGQYSDCINIIGSHKCLCWSGFNSSNKDSPVSRNNSCQDIDECLVSPSVCGPDSSCTNEIGSYSCSCLNGFTVTNSNLTISINNPCRDVNECLNTLEVCGPNSRCNNSFGIYNCSCLIGFTVTNMNQPISTSNPCNVTLPLTEYLIEIQINSVDSSVTDQLRTLLMSFNLPYIISDSTNITEISITTVCSLNQTQFQCKCEGLFVWPNDTCHSYEACDDITNGSCTCINALPVDGQFCQVLPSKYMIDIDVRFFDLFLVNYLRSLIMNISLPLTLSNSINITDIDMTTVCGLNGTQYECKCEERHVWPNDTCRAYHECDEIVGGTCGCIQALPSEGPLCQRDINECEDAVSVCGQYSDCINIIGSHKCSCWSGFNSSNKDSPVSRNNSCQDIDECLVSPSVCGPDSSCTNEIGSYNCSCLNGFTVTNSNLTISINNPCRDVNECLNTLEVCGPNSRCNNSFGIYNCSCLIGFTVTNMNQPISTSNPCNVTLPLTEYLIEIQINSVDSSVTDQLRTLLMSFNLPYIISDSTNITEISITTVCSLNQTQYQCKCEGLFVWPNDTCHSYEACDDITNGSCTCINALPVDGQFCQVLPSKYMIDIDVRFFDLFLVNYLRSLIMNISLPLTLSNSINITDIDMTTVCGLNGTQYECKCEERHVWPNDTCRAYHECDEIVGGTCGCIQALPSEGPLCQRDINECEDAVSVCGQYSDCINIIGSHKCLCWSGFNSSNKDSPVSRNNSCQDIDECLVSPSVCGPDSSCTNEIGSYNCSCLNGFTVTNSNLTISINNPCRDVNECLNTLEVCGPNSRCNNSFGSYNCSCLIGFTVTNMNQPISTSNPCNVTLPLTEYLIEIQINSVDSSVTDQLRTLLMSFNLPYIISDSTNITEISITTVCSLNQTQYQCKCEGLFVWPNDTCHSYEACDDITNGSCTCINALPVDGQFCQVLPSKYMIDIDVRFFDLFLVNYLRSLIMNISLPLTLSNSINITDIDMTTVCGLNGTQYECKCEERHVWPNDTCRAYHECDEIVGGTCGCIQALPSEGPLCQRDINECEDAVSVCGQYSDCINIIGSHKCLCWSGFNSSNKDSPVSRNNSCQDIDECLVSPSVCGPDSSCTNEIGSYNCSCLNGFTVTNSNLTISINNPCRDVNECLNTLEVCGPNSRCNNSFGSYNCSCLIGFTVTNMNQPISTSNPCNVTLPLTEYLIEIQINSVDSSVTDQLRTLLMSFNLPYIISDSTNITEISITTVCSLNQTQYQCKCEGLFVWPNDTCHSYEACDDITNGSCTCINALPVDGQFCQVLPSKYMIDIDVRFFDVFLVNYLRSLIMNISLPLTLSNSINITDIDMTTVCGLNGTQYECKCEERHVWPNDTCRAYHECDEIVGGTCGCIQALPSEGPLCQRDINECEDAVSVCGQYSDCINIIGSHKCLCWSGFNSSNKDSPVSRNNSCQAASPGNSPSRRACPAACGALIAAKDPLVLRGPLGLSTLKKLWRTRRIAVIVIAAHVAFYKAGFSCTIQRTVLGISYSDGGHGDDDALPGDSRSATDKIFERYSAQSAFPEEDIFAGKPHSR